MIETEKHIVDTLIEERAENLMKHPILWRFIKQTIYPLLKYPQAIEVSDHCGPLPAREIFEYFHNRLDMRLTLEGVENIPRTGRLIITANHPTGIADGFAVYSALREIRPDLCFLANRDAIRIAPEVADMVIPVEWVVEKRNTARAREMLKALRTAFNEERAVVIFPSGRLAKPTWRGLEERLWLPTTINLMRKYGAPIIPLNMAGRNSLLYYVLYIINEELKNMTLFNEMVNKDKAAYRLTFGKMIETHHLPPDAEEAVEALQTHVVSKHRVPLDSIR